MTEISDQLLKRDVILVATAGASLLNGMHFSPYFEPVLVLLKPFTAALFRPHRPLDQCSVCAPQRSRPLAERDGTVSRLPSSIGPET